jgi:NitT/TauT family transport system permease protein
VQAVDRRAARARAAAAGSARRRGATSPWRRIGISTLGFVAFLLAWHFAIVLFDIKPFVAPKPIDVLHALRTQREILFINAIPTIIETLGGFLIGNVVAILMAAGFVHNRIFQQTVYPLAATLRTIPIIAISPIIVLMLGVGYESKIMIVALITFFPTLVNMVDGLRAVDPQALELMHVLSASRWEVFRYLRWPTSLPYLFSALRISSTTSLIGAVIAEWISTNAGLGYLILASTYDYRTPLLYATMAVASAIALTLFGLVTVLERYAVSWRQAAGPGEE